MSSRLTTDPPKALCMPTVDCLQHYSFLFTLIDKHTPLITKLANKSKSDSDPRFTSSVCVFRSTVQHAMNFWKQTRALCISSLSAANYKLILSSTCNNKYYRPTPMQNSISLCIRTVIHCF